MNNHRASDTAVLIARSLVLADATPALRPLLAPETAALTRSLLTAAGPQRWFNFLLRYRCTRALFFALERLTLPGIFLHYLVRKHRLADYATEALQKNCRQLVVLGAGLDTLAWRQSRQSTVPCFELDHPATQSVKQLAYQNDPQRTPLLIPTDLSHESPSQKLRSTSSFDATLPTVFIAEGLLMYFPPARVSELIRELAALAAPGSRFIFTFMEAHHGLPLAFHNASSAVNTWLRARQEPFLWGLARTEVGAFAKQHGWQLDDLSSPDKLRATILAQHNLTNARLAVGESIALLTKSDPL